MANIDADLSNEALKNTGLLKKLTGSDDIPAEEKFRNPFHFKNHAKLIFSANQIPKTPDETDAFFARLIIINFLNQYLGDKADPWLIKKLTTEKEMSGLLSVVVARLPRVLDKGIYVSHSSIEDNYAKYIESSNPIRAFVESSIKKDESKNELKDAVYDAYVRFCKDKKLGIESNYSFSRILKKEHGLKDDKLTKDRKRDYYWLGVELKDWKEAEEGQDTLH
jgi:putative DNA primase/helicase